MVRVVTATSPGHPGRANEDFVGTAPGVLVLLDGAGIKGTEAICRHGVRWYSHTLGETVLTRMARDDDADPAEALADSIDHVAGLHRHTCDLANPSSPQATVAMLRIAGRRVDYLVLADAYVVLEPTTGAPQVVTDPREVAVRRQCTVPLAGLAAGTPEYDQALPSVIDAFRARRNQPGGYWIAKDDGQVASQAVTGSMPVADLAAAALLSNGASRIVDPYRLTDWPGVFRLLRTDGPDALLRTIRAAETGTEESDDATVAYCDRATE